MSISKDALSRFILVNDIFGESVLNKKEFFDFEKTFKNNDLSNIFDLKLWELADKTTKKNAEKIYQALKQDYNEILKQLNDLKITVLCKNDEFYPKKIYKKLKDEAPILLYCIGDISLLNKKAAAVTGSRDISERAKKFAKDIGETIAKENSVLITGGARGSDIIATKSAIKNGGKVVWFSAAPLIQILKNKTLTDLIKKGSLCVCTDFSPFGEFEGKKALRRNKYIYANTDTAFVCQCNSKISGTYSGANYCLKNNLTDLYVFENGYDSEKLLIKNGANSIIDR